MSAAKDLLLATNNPKKIKEIREILGIGYTGNILCASDYSDIAEPEESGKTFADNARLKAEYYCKHTGLISLADDSGLVVDAMDGRPGVHSARYAETEPLRIAKMLGELLGVEAKDRTARFECALCVAMPGGTLIQTHGTLEGSIAFEARGSQGFGYDPIFLVGNSDRTLAEFSAAEKNSISHRSVAMKKIEFALLDALND